MKGTSSAASTQAIATLRHGRSLAASISGKWITRYLNNLWNCGWATISRSVS